jgi:hypothetical protein
MTGSDVKLMLLLLLPIALYAIGTPAYHLMYVCTLVSFMELYGMPEAFLRCD